MALAAGTPPDQLDLVEAAALSPDEVLAVLGSRAEGLTSDEVEERLRRFGSNALAVHRVHATSVLFRQIRNPILVLLLGAALVSGLTGGGTNAVIIAVIVALSVGLGFFNEYRAALAMASLRAQIRQEAEVRRNGRTVRVPVTDLVPGDVVALRIGALVPADLRLLAVDQSSATKASSRASRCRWSSPSRPSQGVWRRTSRAVPSWGRSSTRGRRSGWSCRRAPTPPSGRSRPVCPSVRGRRRSRSACRASRGSCSALPRY